MLNIVYYFVVLISLIANYTNAQSLQTCTCEPLNTCYQNLITDGSGIIDIRIVNNGQPTVTLPPRPTPSPTLNCTARTQICCIGAGVTGCGLRWNIPTTPLTTPSAGQARYGSQPWTVAILATDNSTVGSGVLISPLHVLTVAHKVLNRAPSSIRVRLGDWDANRLVEPYAAQDRSVTVIRTHPQFGPQNLTNNIAVLLLSSPVQLGPSPNPAINTACLPDQTTPINNMRCLVSGWGKDAFTGTLQAIIKEVDVPIITTNDCQNQLRNNTKLGPTFVLNPTSFICAGGEVGKDACVGDGGSGLMCSINGRYQVIGLVAWGIGCGTSNVPGVYVRVQSFLPWINLNTV